MKRKVYTSLVNNITKLAIARLVHFYFRNFLVHSKNCTSYTMSQPQRFSHTQHAPPTQPVNKRNAEESRTQIILGQTLFRCRTHSKDWKEKKGSSWKSLTDLQLHIKNNLKRLGVTTKSNNWTKRAHTLNNSLAYERVGFVNKRLSRKIHFDIVRMVAKGVFLFQSCSTLRNFQQLEKRNQLEWIQ